MSYALSFLCGQRSPSFPFPPLRMARRGFPGLFSEFIPLLRSQASPLPSNSLAERRQSFPQKDISLGPPPSAKVHLRPFFLADPVPPSLGRTFPFNVSIWIPSNTALVYTRLMLTPEWRGAFFLLSRLSCGRSFLVCVGVRVSWITVRAGSFVFSPPQFPSGPPPNANEPPPPWS